MNQIGEPTDNYLKRDKCRIFWIETPVNGAVPVTIDHDGHDRRRCEQNMKRWFINKAKTKTMMEFSHQSPNYLEMKRNRNLLILFLKVEIHQILKVHEKRLQDW